MDKYNYQINVAKEAISMLESDQFEATIVAAAPSAGKSTIIIEILNDLLNKNPNHQVIVLAHNQNNLVDQMLESFKEGFIAPQFNYGTLTSNAQVRVGIPSSSLKIDKCDILVVDEAHQYYLASMVQGIIEKHKPSMQILMTGSPSIFNEINKENLYPKYGMVYVSGEELVTKDVYANVIVDVAIKGNNVVESFVNAYNKAKEDDRFDDSKIMIACKSIEEAHELGGFLGANNKVSISTSNHDTNNVEIKNFKQGNTNVLIVVNRGVLGFSDNNVTALFDLKCSKSKDNRYQLLARVFRKHPRNISKFYVSISTMEKMDQELQVIYDTTQLMNRENFVK